MISDILKWILKVLEPGLNTVFQAVRDLFENHPARLAVAMLLAVAAAFCGSMYARRVSQYQEIVSSTVRAEMEGTPERFKVFGAFIMSGIESTLHKRIKAARVTEQFVQEIDIVDKALKSSGRYDATSLSLAVADGVADDWRRQPQNGVLTDGSSGYLFFPLSLLRLPEQGPNLKAIIADSLQPKTKYEALNTAAAGDSVIADDIEISQRLAPLLDKFTRVPLFESLTNGKLQELPQPQPVQVYYITKNGLARILNNSGPNQREVYRNLFRATTFFPSRPYVVEALNRGDPDMLTGISGEIQKHFYVSRPYVDLGGFGVVVTLSRAIRYPGHSDAVICFDLRVPLDNPVNNVFKKLRAFGARPETISCDIGPGSGVNCPPEQGKDPEYLFGLRDSLSKTLAEGRITGNLSNVVGNISILPTPSTAAVQADIPNMLLFPVRWLSGAASETISFAIPKSPPQFIREGVLRSDFFVSTLNFQDFLQLTSLLGFAAVSLSLLAFSQVIVSWQRESKRRKDLQQAFKAFDVVLYGAPTPYCRLDAADKIVDCNTAFCGMLGRDADQNSVITLKGQSFESLVAPRSKGTYRDVQEKRKRGVQVAPYTLFFSQETGAEIESRVESGQVPGQTAGTLPETFGIFIPKR